MMKALSYLNEQGQLLDSCSHKIDFKVLLKGYKDMMITRLVDEHMFMLQREGVISFAISSLGEEACAVASAAALDMEDWMYPQYRESGIQDYVHHMFCNAKDLTLGRQMPNHFGSKLLNVVTVSSPIGTKIPHVAGCAYAMKLQNDKHVAIGYFGEGATSEGDFHAGLNFAAVLQVPGIFFCRNNGYAISTHISRQYASDGIAPKGIGYGVTTFRIDGNDFFAIHETVSKARQICLEGKGPILIEALTYRLGAHSTSDDPSLYRDQEEVNRMKKKCPILRLRLYLESQGLWDELKEKELINSIIKEINVAIDIAKKTPKPELKSLIENVYFEVPENLKEQYEELKECLSNEKEV
jgi:2-oxoisovalerate dehydrogenase E1 component alpha subunit